MTNKKILQYRNHNYYDLSIYQSGYEKCKSNHSYGPCKRDCFLLHFVIEGKGTYIVRDTEYKLQKGDCFLVIPDENTSYYANKDDPYEFAWVGFRGTDCQKFMEKIGFYSNNQFVRSCRSQYELLKKYFLSFIDVDEQFIDEKAYLQALGTLYSILAILDNENNRIPSMVRLNMDNWSQIKEYINNNYGGKITIEGLAFYVGFHRSSLYKIFKTYSGVSPSTYILYYRLEKAINLIKTTDRTFSSIAYECGFNSLQYFNRAFKKKFGKTPQQVRIMS